MPALVCGHFLGLNTHISFGIYEDLASLEFALLLKWQRIYFCVYVCMQLEKMAEINMFSPRNRRENCPG